jgi:hypothetical protein
MKTILAITTTLFLCSAPASADARYYECGTKWAKVMDDGDDDIVAIWNKGWKSIERKRLGTYEGNQRRLDGKWCRKATEDEFYCKIAESEGIRCAPLHLR